MQIFEGRINCVNQEEVTFEQRRHWKVVFALKSFFFKGSRCRRQFSNESGGEQWFKQNS